MEILTSRPPDMPMSEYRAIQKLQKEAIKRKRLGEFVHVSSEMEFNSVGKFSGLRTKTKPFTGPVLKPTL